MFGAMANLERLEDELRISIELCCQDAWGTERQIARRRGHVELVIYVYFSPYEVSL